MPDPEVTLYFDGVRRHSWSIDGPSFHLETITDPASAWLPKFAAIAYARVVDQWLVPALGLVAPPSEVSGVEVRVRTREGVELCAVTTDKAGDFSFRPSEHAAAVLAARDVARAVQSDGELHLDLRLSARKDGSWGSEVRLALVENYVWNETRTRRAAEAVTSPVLTRWVARQRALDDADLFAMRLALIENVRLFLHDASDCSKASLEPWKKFVTDVAGREIDVLLTFCPRRLVLWGAPVLSSALDRITPPPATHVRRVAAAVDEACATLKKPRFTLDALVPVSRVACAPEAVLRVRSGRDRAPWDFYVDETEMSAIDACVRARGYDVAREPARRVPVVGILARVERWTVDHRVALRFVEKRVIDRFEHTLDVGGVEYRCQKSGIVATYAIARLIVLKQEGRTAEAEALRGVISDFHARAELGFPLVDGRRRKKRTLYFSDYNRTFRYNSDESESAPDQVFPINYTRHMRDDATILSSF